MTAGLPPAQGVGIAALLPAVAHSLGGPGEAAPRLPIRPARRAVTVLIDGLGARALTQRKAHARFLTSWAETSTDITVGFPSTTATSIASFGTGLNAGRHGLVGYEARDPDTGRVFNELTWVGGPDPGTWQPNPTVFQTLVADGIPVVVVGPSEFSDSPLTRAVLRGGRYVGAPTLEASVDAALAAVTTEPRMLIHLYWPDLDKMGHVFGAESWQWVDELERIDHQLSRLAAGLPKDASLTVTADHGMLTVPFDERIDVAATPALALGVTRITAEFRAPFVFAEPGAQADVVAAWREFLGERAHVYSRAEAVAADLFGPIRPGVDQRFGDAVVVMGERGAIVDSRTAGSRLLSLVGLHGSTSADEALVPVIHVPAADEPS